MSLTGEGGDVTLSSVLQWMGYVDDQKTDAWGEGGHLTLSHALPWIQSLNARLARDGGHLPLSTALHWIGFVDDQYRSFGKIGEL